MNMIAVPEWTEYRKKSGLDPLGMQNTSVGLYQRLLPGISNVTLRMRYYGLYAWLSYIYAKHKHDPDPKIWQRVIRRAEALYALVAQYRGGEAGVAGVLWAQRKRTEAGPAGEISFAEDARPDSESRYLRQAWGAYGAAYASQLYEIGIFAEGREHAIPLPSPEIGEPLATCFETQIGDAAARFLEILERGSADPHDLDALSVMLPSAIGAGSAERQLYEDLIFARTALQRPNDLSRRQSLLLILTLAQQLGRAPDVSDVRWALYAGRLPDGGMLVLPEGLADQRARWRVYQLNDLSHVCFEALLNFVLARLEVRAGGVPLAELIGEAVAAMTEAADAVPPNWRAFLEESTPAENAWSASDAAADLAIAERIMKSARPQAICDAATAWAAVQLLAILHNRFLSAPADVAESLKGFKGPNFRSILTETAFLDQRLDAPFTETLGRLIEERVIRRHLWIALRKLRYQGDYTFLIESDNGRVRLRDMDGAVYTNPRLGPAITFLKDIHLLGAEGLTERGTQCLAGAQ